jgi:hypothetical protein
MEKKHEHAAHRAVETCDRGSCRPKGGAWTTGGPDPLDQALVTRWLDNSLRNPITLDPVTNGAFLASEIARHRTI